MAEKPLLAFAHGYGLDNMPKGLKERRKFRKEKRRASREGRNLEYTPGRLSRMVIDAALEAESEFNGVAGSALFGYPPHGEISEQYIRRIAPSTKIINFGRAWTTNTEIRAIKRGVIANGWQDCEIDLFVARPHKKRAEVLAKRATKSRKMKKRGIVFNVKTAEDILFNPKIVGEQKAEEYGTKYAGIEKDKKYKKLEKQGSLAVIVNKSRVMTRMFDFAYAIYRPPF